MVATSLSSRPPPRLRGLVGHAALLPLLALVSSCLPRGEPPAGRQLLAERQITIGALVPPNGDGAVRVLFMRPGEGYETRDVYLLTAEADGGPPREQLVAKGADVTQDFGCLNMVAPCSMVTAGGLILLWIDGGFAILDGYSGQRFDFAPDIGPGGLPGFIDWSYAASGARARATVGSRTTVIDVGRGATVLPSTSSPSFGGDDLYYLSATNELRRLRPSGDDELVATDVAEYQVWGPAERLLVTFDREDPHPDGTVAPFHSWRRNKDYVAIPFMIDRASGKETRLPFNPMESGVGSSPDGHWLMKTEGDWFDPTVPTTVTFFDTRSGEQRVVSIGGSFGSPVWRPGHDEVWTSSWSPPTPTTWIVRTDGSLASLPNQTFAGFSDDGAFWLTADPVAEGESSDKTPMKLASADDPTGPRVAANSPGSGINRSWWLADGRFLMQAYYKNYQRPDVIAVDPRTGESRRLAERGRVAAVGKKRLVGMFHYADGCGDLTSVDLDTGRQTLLAPEFAVTAFVEPQGDDPVAKGTHVAFQYQARASSPYDGLWMVTVP